MHGWAEVKTVDTRENDDVIYERPLKILRNMTEMKTARSLNLIQINFIKSKTAATMVRGPKS